MTSYEFTEYFTCTPIITGLLQLAGVTCGSRLVVLFARDTVLRGAAFAACTPEGRIAIARKIPPVTASGYFTAEKFVCCNFTLERTR